jgi:hypothetical protein
VGGPAAFKSELVTVLASMLGVRVLILTASSSTSSIRTQSALVSNAPTILSDPRVISAKTGNSVDSDLFHAAYQMEGQVTKAWGERRPGGPLVVTANAPVLGPAFLQEATGKASQERITTLLFRDGEAKMTDEGKDFTQRMKEFPGKMVPFFAMVGAQFTRDSFADWVDTLKALAAEKKLDIPDRQCRDRAVQLWFAQAVCDTCSTQAFPLIQKEELLAIASETFHSFSELVNDNVLATDTFWSHG